VLFERTSQSKLLEPALRLQLRRTLLECALPALLTADQRHQFNSNGAVQRRAGLSAGVSQRPAPSPSSTPSTAIRTRGGSSRQGDSQKTAMPLMAWAETFLRWPTPTRRFSTPVRAK